MTRDQVWQAFYDQMLELVGSLQEARLWYPIWQRRNRMLRFAVSRGAQVKHWSGEPYR